MGPPHLSQSASRDKYALPRNKSEGERLDSQHSFITELLGGRLIVDENVNIEPTSRVLDAGTGAGSWLFDLATTVPGTAELVGIDISSALFPEDPPSNVELYELSILRLPAKWQDHFDLIHNRLLAVAFTVEQWRTACSELFRVLKPGGAIQFMEYGHYRSLSQQCPALEINKVVDMIDAVIKKRGVLAWDTGIELPKMLEEAGFTDVQVEVCNIRIGRQWGEAGVNGARILEGVFRGVGHTLQAEDDLGLCYSQLEIDETICDAMKVCDETPGLFVPFYAITARKGI